jgi:hypothetical protein
MKMLTGGPTTNPCGTPGSTLYGKAAFHSNGHDTLCWSSNYRSTLHNQNESSVIYCLNGERIAEVKTDGIPLSPTETRNQSVFIHCKTICIFENRDNGSFLPKGKGTSLRQAEIENKLKDRYTDISKTLYNKCRNVIKPYRF